MSFQAMKWAHEQALPDSESKLLLLILANYAGHDNSCWPSIRTLASECILSERTIQYKIRLLQDMKLIGVSVRNNKEGDQTSNVYTLLAPPGAALAPPPRTPCTTPGAGPAPKPVSTEPVNEPPKGSGSQNMWALKTQMEAKESMAQELRDRHASEVPFGQRWDSPAYRDKYVALLREIRAIRGRIAGK